MSLEVKKTFTISNKDAEVLSTICELARRYISKEKSQKPIQLIERKDLYEVRFVPMTGDVERK